MRNWKICSGTRGYDEKELREMEEKFYDQTRDFNAVFNHWLAELASPSRLESLKNVKVPSLVIHGESDIVLPPEHGEATAKAIPYAKYILIPHMGHVVCRYFFYDLIRHICEHAKTHSH